MAVLQLKKVLKDKKLEIYTTGEYLKKFHPNLNQYSLQYAIKHNRVHYCKVGRTCFIINTEVTKSYTPRLELKGKRSKSAIKDKPKVKYHASGGEIEASNVFTYQMYKRCGFIKEHCPSASPNNIEYAVRAENIDVVYIGSVRLIVLTELTQQFRK